MGVLIPLFALFSQVGLANSLFGAILAFAATSIPFTTYLLTGFFSGVPAATGDTATMDGATDWQNFAQVYLLLGRSGMITARSSTLSGSGTSTNSPSSW